MHLDKTSKRISNALRIIYKNIKTLTSFSNDQNIIYPFHKLHKKQVFPLSMFCPYFVVEMFLYLKKYHLLIV